MTKMIIISIFLTLTACSTSQISEQFSGDRTYINFKSGALTTNNSYWKRVETPSEKVIVITTNTMTAPKPISSCATFLLGIDSNGQIKEIVLTHSYGNNQVIRNQAKNYRSSQWVPTINNPSKLAAVEEVLFTYVLDKSRNKEEFEKECANYPTGKAL